MIAVVPNPILENTIRLQQIASDPNNSVFVSASAGSGKTKVLTDRVLRLLLRGTRPAKILCLTFTKIAATEMKGRIYRELSDWATVADQDLKDRLFKLSGCLPTSTQISFARKLFAIVIDDDDGLRISTIHSFCEMIIRKFPFEAKVSPNFQVISSQIETKLLNQARKKLLTLATANEFLAIRVENITSKLNEDSFLDVTSELLKQREKIVKSKKIFLGIEGMIEKIYHSLNYSVLKNEEDLHLDFNQDREFARESLQLACQLMLSGSEKTDQKYSKVISDYLKNPQPENFQRYKNLFLTSDLEPRKVLVTSKVAKLNPDVELFLLKEQKRMQQFIEDLNSLRIAKSSSDLIWVIDKILEIYSELKASSAYLDYNDLIIKTANLLKDSASSDWIRYKLDGGVEHILVDESQDTNNYQWDIIKAITEDFFAGVGAVGKDRTIFIVGDEKQSIYSFQGAEPEIFSEVFHYYQAKLKALDRVLIKVNLDSSFRSHPAVLSLVDLVFAQNNHQKAISKLNSQIRHQAIKDGYFGRVELWPIISVGKKRVDPKTDYQWQLNFEPSDEYKSKELLAQIIAKTIRRWFDNKKIVIDKSGLPRPIRYSDIMILLKNRTNNLGNLLVKYLGVEGVAVSGADRINLTKNIIVLDLIAIAKFILLPEDDLNLACLLKSPVLEVEEEELLDFCLFKNEHNVSLIDAIRQSQTTKAEFILAFLDDLVSDYQAKPNDIYQLFSDVLEVKNIRRSIIERFGREAVEIINQFLIFCLDYQNNSNPSLENFVDLMEEVDLEIKNFAVGDEFDQIRITTIHGSKGLEAPIVFLADAAHSAQAKMGDGKNKLIWLKKVDQDGESYDLPFWVSDKSEENKLVRQIKELNQINQQEEYLRQLYVAMTRAANELYITGFGDQITKDCWYNLVKEVFLLAKNSRLENYDFNNLLNNREQKDCLCGDGLIMDDPQSVQANLLASSLLTSSVKTEVFNHEWSEEFFNRPINDQEVEKTLNPSLAYHLKDQELPSPGKSVSNTASYGRIIHKILEILPDNENTDCQHQRSLVDRYLGQQYPEIDRLAKEDIIYQINRLLVNPETSYLFRRDNSKSEVAVLARIDGALVSGKIDRLVFDDQRVIIVDYKTDKKVYLNPNQVPSKYREQLGLYKKIIEKIYPEKSVVCAIVWTSLGYVTFVDNYQ